MSKLLILLLLALNLVLALLIWQDSSKQTAPIIPGGNIQLLSEVQPQASESQAGVETETSMDAAEPMPETSIQTTAATEPAPAKKPAPEPVKPKARPTTAATIHCYRYGPLDSRLSALGIMARFKEGNQKQKIIEEPASIRFWLLAKPGQTSDLQKLKAMSLGDYQGNLVLGVFTTKTQAQSQMTEFQSTNANLHIEEVATDKSKFWVLFGSSKANLDLKALHLEMTQGHLIKSKQCP
jgi:hypothetical protein